MPVLAFDDTQAHDCAGEGQVRLLMSRGIVSKVTSTRNLADRMEKRPIAERAVRYITKSRIRT